MYRLAKIRCLIVVVGGATAAAEEGCLKSIELQEPRRAPSLFYQDSQVVVIGGCRKWGDHLKSIETFSIKQPSFTQQNFMTLGFSCSAFCQLEDGTGFMFGGFNKMGCLNIVSKIINGRVIECPPMPTDLKNATAVATHDDFVYVIGGWDGKRTLNTVFKYADNKLHYEGQLPYSVEGHTSSIVGDLIFNVGGFDGVSLIATVSMYDIRTRETIILNAKLKRARENHCTVILQKNGKDILLVIGGWDGSKALRDCEAFEIINESPFLVSIEWTAHLNEPRNRPAVVVIPT